MSNNKVNTKDDKQVEQNLVGSGEPLESQDGSGGHLDMVHKGSSGSHSGCGTRSYKQGNLQSKTQTRVLGGMQCGILKSNKKGRAQLSLSLSPSLSHSEGDREIESERYGSSEEF